MEKEEHEVDDGAEMNIEMIIDQDEKTSDKILGENKATNEEPQVDHQEEQKETAKQVPNDEGWANDGDDLDIDLGELDNEADAFGVFEENQ